MTIAQIQAKASVFESDVSKRSFSKSGNSPETSALPMDLFFMGTIPVAGVVGTPGLSGVSVSGKSITGQFPFDNPTAPDKTMVARFKFAAYTSGTLMIYDRLWWNSGINVTLTSEQTINSVAWPARDLDGSSNGRGVWVGLHILPSTDTTNAALVIATVSYTNSANVSGRTGYIFCLPTCEYNHIFPMCLQNGDVGVRSIQTLTLSASLGAGTVSLVAFVPIVSGSNADYGQYPVQADVLSLGLAQIRDDAVLGLFWHGTSTANVHGELVLIQG